MKKCITLFLCIAMLLAMTAGCVQEPAETETSSAGTETSAAPQDSSAAPAQEFTYTYQSVSASDMFIKCFTEYQKTHPNMHLDPITKDAADLTALIPSQVETNTVPDITWNNAVHNSNYMVDYPDVYVDMTDIINTRFAGRFVDGTFNLATTIDGRLSCLPCEMQIQGWLINKALFAQYNLEIPETFDDLLNAAAVFRANGITLLGCGTGDVWPTWGFYHWLQLWGIEDEREAFFADHSVGFADTDFSQALYKMAELYAAGAFPDDNSTITYEQTKTLFLSEQCAMMTTSTDWLTDIVGSDLDLNGDIEYSFGVTFPDAEALGHTQNQAIKMMGNGYALAASMPQDKFDALLDFFDWMYSDAGADLLIADGLVLPLTSFNLTTEVTPLTQSIIDLTMSSGKKITRTAGYCYLDTYENQIDILLDAYLNLDGTINGLINGTVTEANLPEKIQEFDAMIVQAIADFQAWKANNP